MKTQRKHGFTIVELVVVIAVIAILAAVLIPTFVSIIKKANNSAYLQERTSQQIADLAEKVENQNYLTWEDFEAVLARELAKVGSKSTEDIQNAIKVALAEHAVSDSGLSEAQVQKIINEAMSGQLTTAQVQAIVEQSIKNAGISVGTSGGVTAAQVQSIVSAAIANIPTQTGVTPAMVQSAVASALENAQVTGVSEADIKKALEAFGVSTLTEQQIVEIVNQIATDVSGKTGNEQIVATLNIRAAGNGKATLYDTFVAMSISDPTTAVKSITAGETILWDSVDKKFVLDIGDGSHTGARYWTVSDDISTEWSTYYTGTASTISTTKGFDAGTTTSVTSVTYTNTTGSAQNVVIRTNGGTLTIDAENDTVMHYGEAQVVTLTAVSTSSYYEHGSVNLVDIKKGRLVITNDAKAEVGTIYLTATNDAYDGIILATQNGSELPDVVARETVSNPTTGEKLVVTIQTNVDANGENPDKTEVIYLYPERDVKEATNGYNVSDLGLLVVEAITTEAQTQAAEQITDAAVLESVTETKTADLQEVTAGATMFAGGKGTEEKPYLIANANQWLSMCTLYYDESNDEYGIMQGDAVYVKLVNDINLSQIELFDTSFAYGLHLDGNGKTVFGAHFADVFGYYGVDYWGENEIKNITFDNCQAQYGLLGYGTHDSTDIVKFSNVTIKNSSAKHGAFLYYTGGATIEFEKCSTESVSVTDKAVMAVGGYVGNGQGIVINNCKFGGSVVSTSEMAAGFVGQGKAVITNSEVTTGSVIRNIKAGGAVAVYDGQGGGAREGDNNTFNGVLSCDTQTKAQKQGTNATWKQFIGLKVSDFNISEDGTIVYTGENREFTKITISESIFERSIYDPTGTYLGQYLPGGFSCYWEDLITVENISSNNLYKIDKVTGLVNYVSEFYADKVSCSTTVEPDVEWTRYRSYLDRETGTLYYNGVYEGDAYCGFLGTAAKLDANNNLIAKLPCTGTINVKINAYDASNGLLGSVTLSYSVTFAAAE